MWMNNCIIISIWKPFLIIFGLHAVSSQTQSGQRNAGIKLSCDPKRVEIAFPVIDDSLGRKTSEFYSETSPRDLLHVSIRWRYKKLTIILYKNIVTLPESISEWHDDNMTYAKTIDKSCFYHGYIKNQRTSYVALSTCGGLGGYIQTDTELLFIQSRIDIDPRQRNAPHLIYTCESISRERQPSHPKSTAETMRKRRSKRYARRTRYLEVQAVVDHKLVRAIGSKVKTENYVMALMNIANTVYQHSTLGQDIKVVLIRIIFLERNQQRDVLTRNYALRTVNKFCKWSMDNIPRGRRMNYDISVLITDESLGPSGFAPITGLCNPVRSCAAIHDDGFTTGFVISHEMAHVFGLFHDGHGNHCYGAKYRTSMMAAVVESKLNHFWWSECSKRRMAELIPYLSCLNNRPTPIAGHYPLKATQKIQEDLGQPWSLHFQCEREFGPSFRLCQAFGSDPCQILWCASVHNPHYCRTKRGPPLSGTKCGPDMECHNSRCQYVGSQSPVNGAWSRWSRWSECSSGCGVGTKQRSRACNNPTPMYGGEDCKGETTIKDTCYNDTCDNYEDIRAGECSVWDSLQIRYGTHKWLPFEPVNASVQCKQTCKSFYTREIVTIEVDVSDGTPCSYLRNASDICLEGKCIPVGCDGVTNSTKKMDVCGICGGDGSQCKVIEGVFTFKPKSGKKYLKVIRLPLKARNITIIQMNDTDNFLALEDVVYGKFLLGGENKQSRTEDMIIKGAMFYYKRKSPTQKETISSPGPLLGSIDVMFYTSQVKRGSKPVSISFRYTVNKRDMTYEKDQFKWKFKAWSPCSVTCGEGIQVIMYNCINKLSGEIVDKSSCAVLDTPRRDEVKCYRQDCSANRYNYVMLNSYSDCDAKCGENGTQKQKYECELHNPITGTYTNVKMRFCEHLESPNNTRPCKGDPCQLRESYNYVLLDSFHECDAECDDTGTEKQKYICKHFNPRTKIHKTVDMRFCKYLPPPNATRACTGDPCQNEDSYNFIMLNSFMECNAKCGEIGIQLQEYECERYYPKTKTYKTVDMTFCDHLQHPNVTRKCRSDPCQNEERVTYEWDTPSEWSACDSIHKCGVSGNQSRSVQCVAVRNSKKKEVADSSKCSVTAKPEETQMCPAVPCPDIVTYQWDTPSEWSACDSIHKCGMPGHKTRLIQCVELINGEKKEVADDSKCNVTTKPEETQMCPAVPCPDVYEWFANERWSKCPCGGENTQTREIVCRQVKEIDGEKMVKDVDVKHCKDIDNKPNKTRKCNGGPCPPKFQWIRSQSDFETCDAECEEKGKENAKLFCQQVVIWKKEEIIERVDESFCKSVKKPKVISRVCTGPPCVPVFQWNVTDEWTACEAKCDEEDIQYRIYKCQKSIKNKPFWDVEDHLCANVKHENETKSCKGPLCPLKWQIGDWTECSVTCGRGKRYRNVYCGDPESDFDDVRCKDTPPATSKRCALNWCPEPEGKECKDVYSFCKFYSGLNLRCKSDSFLKMCCKTCQPHIKKSAARSRRRIKKISKKKKSATSMKKKKSVHQRQKRRSRRSQKHRQRQQK